MDLKQWDGHAVISHKGGHSKSKVDALTQGRVFTIAIAFITVHRRMGFEALPAPQMPMNSYHTEK